MNENILKSLKQSDFWYQVALTQEDGFGDIIHKYEHTTSKESYVFYRDGSRAII